MRVLRAQQTGANRPALVEGGEDRLEQPLLVGEMRQELGLERDHRDLKLADQTMRRQHVARRRPRSLDRFA